MSQLVKNARPILDDVMRTFDDRIKGKGYGESSPFHMIFFQPF